MSDEFLNNEENDDLIELIDENGESVTFELLAAFDFNDTHYLAVSEPIDDEDAEIEVIILKVIPDEDGNDTYVPPEDDEADAAFEAFQALVNSDSEEE